LKTWTEIEKAVFTDYEVRFDNKNELMAANKLFKVKEEFDAKTITKEEATNKKGQIKTKYDQISKMYELMPLWLDAMAAAEWKYSSDKEFNIVSQLDGKITSIKEDEILGNIVEIEHSDNIVTIYQSIKNVKVKIGDKVKQGDIIALSGSNKLENEKENCLHFEVYKEGTLINPENFYNLELSN